MLLMVSSENAHKRSYPVCDASVADIYSARKKQLQIPYPIERNAV